MDDTPGYQPLVRSFRPVVQGQVLTARAEARAILNEAQEKAEALLAKTESRVEAAVADAYRQAREQAEASASERLAAAVSVAGAHAHAAEGALVDAVLSVAERVWGDLGTDRPAAAARVVAEVQAEISSASRLKVRVHPDDVPALERLSCVCPAPDPSLASGDCVVEADGTVYDGRAEVRAELALSALTEALSPLRSGGRDGP